MKHIKIGHNSFMHFLTFVFLIFLFEKLSFKLRLYNFPLLSKKLIFLPTYFWESMLVSLFLRNLMC